MPNVLMSDYDLLFLTNKYLFKENSELINVQPQISVKLILQYYKVYWGKNLLCEEVVQLYPLI